MDITTKQYKEILQQPHIVALDEDQIDNWRKLLLDLMVIGHSFTGLDMRSEIRVEGTDELVSKCEYINGGDDVIYVSIIACSNAAAATIIKILNVAAAFILNVAHTDSMLKIDGNIIYDNMEPVTLQQVFQKYLKLFFN